MVKTFLISRGVYICGFRLVIRIRRIMFVTGTICLLGSRNLALKYPSDKVLKGLNLRLVLRLRMCGVIPLLQLCLCGVERDRVAFT